MRLFVSVQLGPGPYGPMAPKLAPRIGVAVGSRGLRFNQREGLSPE